MDNISIHIAELRKEKGATQEALAEAVGVSIQAVSKWENGGAPDTLLLPAIADFFEVPLDALFGRDTSMFVDIRQIVRKHIFSKAETVKGNPAVLGGTREMTKEFLEICWAINCLFLLPDLSVELDPISKAIEKGETTLKQLQEIARNQNRETSSEVADFYVRNIVDGGTIFMNLKSSPYFMIMSEPVSGWQSSLSELNEYTSFFKTLSDPDSLNSILWLCTRPLQKENDFNAFTKQTFKSNLSFTEEQADNQLEVLKKLKLITQHEIELDEKIIFYKPTVAQSPVLPLLTIAKELISPPGDLFNSFAGHRWNSGRTLIT